MSSHLEQIQTLIAEIDGVLQQPIPRLPWLRETSRESRRVLERIRAYLETQQTEIKAAISQKLPDEGDSTTGALLATEEPESQRLTSDSLIQAVGEEIKTLRGTLIQPLLTDIQALQQERDSLLREIRQLEIQRQQQYSLAQQSAYQQQIITEFLQNIKNYLQETLTQQVVQTLANIEYQFLTQEEFAPPSLTGKAETKPPVEEQEYKPIWDPEEAYGKLRLTPLNRQERLEQWRILQVRVDEILKNLDSTLAVGFETLQRNIQSYEESLSQGIEKIHSLGQQSELLLTQLVSHLAQKLGQEAAGLLQASISTRAKLEPAAEVAKPSETIIKEKKIQSPTTAPPTGEKRPAATSKTTTKKELPSSEKQPTAGKSTTVSKKSDLTIQKVQKEQEAAKIEETPSPVAETKASLDDNKALELLMNLPVISGESTAATETKQQETIPDLLDLLAEWPEPQISSTVTAPTPTTNTLAEEKEDSLAELYTNLLAAEETEGSASDSKPAAGSFDIFEKFEKTLFDGFADPASIHIEEKQTKPVEITPQSIEEFLFGEETTESPQITLENLFPETESKAPSETSQEAAPEITPSQNTGYSEIISIAETRAETDAVLEDDWNSDSFIPASPEEVLLPIVEISEEQTDNFSIDNDTLQQLTKDLSALEGLKNMPQQEEQEKSSEDTTKQSTSEDWDNITLFEWSEEISSPSASESRQSEAPQSLENSETWLDEFNLKTEEELPSQPPAQLQSSPAAVTTPNMTLDEAFTSLTEAIPLERESLEVEPTDTWNPTPTFPVDLTVTSENNSTLDQLFASMNSEPTASEAAESESAEIVVDDFDISLNSAEINSATATDFDELLAELWAETPTIEISPESETPEKKTSS